MGMAARIYGCIVEYGLRTEMQSKIYAHNKKIIEHLPQEDEFPSLSRNMFAITDNYEGGPNFAYTGRIIHFGGNFKWFDPEWKEWKLKFEDLLTKLIWLEADVHLKREYSDIETFTWTVDLLKWNLQDKESIEPIKKEHWFFEGDTSWEFK
jgi:hypothetical protein